MAEGLGGYSPPRLSASSAWSSWLTWEKMSRFRHSTPGPSQGAGCKLVYLPPYYLDLNPIEKAYSKPDGLLRKTQTRTREALIEARAQGLLRTGTSLGEGRWCLLRCSERVAECFRVLLIPFMD